MRQRRHQNSVLTLIQTDSFCFSRICGRLTLSLVGANGKRAIASPTFGRTCHRTLQRVAVLIAHCARTRWNPFQIQLRLHRTRSGSCQLMRPDTSLRELRPMAQITKFPAALGIRRYLDPAHTPMIKRVSRCYGAVMISSNSDSIVAGNERCVALVYMFCLCPILL